MIILFEENTKDFASLGLGILKDVVNCKVIEKLNDSFSLSMEYPITGSNYNKLKIGRILYCKPNPYDEMQAFRIYSISKAISGSVIVDANHISYDLNGIPVKAFDAENLQDVFEKIQNGVLIDNPFTFSSDINRTRTYKTTQPYNIRALLMGDDEESLVAKYKAELKFNNFSIEMLTVRGKNRGAVVRYGHNMTDLEHASSNDLLYNGVFPYYHTESESTETSSKDEFTKAYIVGSAYFAENWLSYSKDGEAFHPMSSSPVQIATEGDYKDKVYVWDETNQIYVEKIYNQQVTLIEGALEPNWISIDWSKFPVVSCRAGKIGYFKTPTDTEWSDLKGVGDVIFEGSITNTDLMSNMIVYFSEVIPSGNESSNKTVTEVVDVQLDEPIIWLTANEGQQMNYNRILMLDLTSEFEEEPTKERLKAKAEEYINENKIGTIKHTTSLSFVDLSSTSNRSKVENMDRVELGDTVKVIYEDADISVDLRVITTEYDVVAGRYDKVELGEKEDTMAGSSVQNGDGISALTNDMGYASITTVHKLIAETVNANYIEALNAKLSKAQIKQLEVEQINVAGIIQASQFNIDSLVAKLLIADNAEISDTLTAGKIKVAGDITVKSGKITIESQEKGTSFIVDNEGNLTANSVNITGGTFVINDGVFEVTNDGFLTAQNAEISGTIYSTSGEIGGFTISENQLSSGKLGSIDSVYVSPGNNDNSANIAESGDITGWAFAAGSNFGVTKNGTLYAKNAKISGDISASSLDVDKGYIANFKISSDNLATYTISETGAENVYYYLSDGAGIYLGANGLNIGGKFKVDASTGTLTASAAKITGGSLNINDKFEVKPDGSLTATEANITGTITTSSGTIGGFTIDGNSIKKGSLGVNGSVFVCTGTISSANIGGSGSISGWAFTAGANFGVTNAGNLYANNANITGNVNVTSGEIHLGKNADDTYKFNVNTKGEMTASAVNINGGSLNINDKFKVSSDGALTANSVDITGGKMHIQKGYSTAFDVSEDGLLTAVDAYISGTLSIQKGSIILGAANSDFRPVTLTAENYIPNKYYKSLTNSTGNKTFVLATEATFDATASYVEYVYSQGFHVDNNGNMYATNAYLSGEIISDKGNIAGFTMNKDAYRNTLYAGTPGSENSVLVSTGTDKTYAISNSGNVSGWVFSAGSKFGVLKDGTLYAEGANIKGSIEITDGIKLGLLPTIYDINIEYTSPEYVENISTDEIDLTDWVDGPSSITSLSLTYNIIDDRDGRNVTSGELTLGDDLLINNITVGKITSGYSLTIDTYEILRSLIDFDGNGIPIEHCAAKCVYKGTYEGFSSPAKYAFEVDKNGYAKINRGELNISNNFIVDDLGNVTIKRGSLNINNKFIVTSDGALTATEANITGEINASSGTIGGFTINQNGLSATGIRVSSVESSDPRNYGTYLSTSSAEINRQKIMSSTYNDNTNWIEVCDENTSNKDSLHIAYPSFGSGVPHIGFFYSNTAEAANLGKILSFNDVKGFAPIINADSSNGTSGVITDIRFIYLEFNADGEKRFTDVFKNYGWSSQNSISNSSNRTKLGERYAVSNVIWSCCSIRTKSGSTDGKGPTVLNWKKHAFSPTGTRACTNLAGHSCTETIYDLWVDSGGEGNAYSWGLLCLVNGNYIR